jgi:hypothetical protein
MLEYVNNIELFNVVLIIAGCILIVYLHWLITDMTLYDVHGNRIPLPKPFTSLSEAGSAHQVYFLLGGRPLISNDWLEQSVSVLRLIRIYSASRRER